MSTLLFKNLNKIYDNNVQAVFDFNLEIKDQEFIVFVGPSGCGKSTTLRMVAGLEAITSGELYLDGVLINNMEPKDRNIAMVFQNYALYPHMSVYGNMAFALKLRKVPRPVYEDVPEVQTLKEQNLNLMKEAKALRKQANKKNESKDILEEVSKKYDEIIKNDDKINELLKDHQIIGVYEEKIKELEKLIAALNKEIAKYQKFLTKDGLEEDTIKILKDAIEQKEAQVEETKKQLEYFQNNKVPVFKSRKLTKYEIDIEINKAAKILDLETYLLRKPSALSGGQRQRVALGRAIVRNPKVFLMDEPLSNLDAKLRVQTRSEIINLHKRVHATTIYVTHDQTEAMTMADRIVVMKDGYIQQIDSPEVLYEDPANTFVAGFIGNPAMNFLEGTFDGKSIVINAKEDAEPVSIKLNATQIKFLTDYKDKEIVVGIRPEKIALKGSPELNKEANYFDIVCNFRELLGYEFVVYTTLAGQKLLIKVGNKQKINSGDKLTVGFNPESLYFFDKETTKRIK